MTFAYDKYKTYIGSSNVISVNFENILEIPLTFIKQTCSNHNTCREPAPELVQSMFKIARTGSTARARTKLQAEIQKEKSELRGKERLRERT